jgi:hypothetical protein
MTDANHSNGENDPKKLWQNQPREETTMTLKLIRQRAQDFRARNRRELFGNIATMPLVVTIAWIGLLHTQDLRFRSAFVVSIVWAVLGQYLVHRGMWSAKPPERSTLTTGVEFYRREIDRRRNLIGRFLLWILGPVILSVGSSILLLTGMARSVGKSEAALPLTVLGFIWIVAVFARRLLNQRELKREADQINEIEAADR